MRTQPGKITALMLISLALLATSAGACPYCGKNRAYLDSMPTKLMDGRGNHHHPVSTQNTEAQAYFDQGLTMCYAFNHDEAIRSFRKAAALDSNLAMAYWGIAYALGTNYNRPIDSLQAAGALEAIGKAQQLAQYASQAERDYIAAMAKRYTGGAKADYVKNEVAYRDAMKELAAKYPDDMDALTIYGESMMNLKPWQLWKPDGSPEEGTPEIVAALEKVLQRNPDHPGANHYYIHAVEASRYPDKALASAHRLENLVPVAGHLVHMPAHTYIRTGDYMGAVEANRRAVHMDSLYVNEGGVGFYGLVYFPHNLHFLAVSSAIAGRYQEAMQAVDLLEKNVLPYANVDPMMGILVPTRYFVLLLFNKWDEILKTNVPDHGYVLTQAIQRFAHGMAYAAKKDVKKANAELAQVRKLTANLPAGCYLSMNNDARNAVPIMVNMLSGAIAEAEGKITVAEKSLREAVAAQDSLRYDEPEGWYFNAREALAALLLRNGRAADAEKLFRAELVAHPRAGRALYGLWQSLEQQGRVADAQHVRLEFERAWRDADVELQLSEL